MEAFADFNMAILLQPDHAEAHYSRGQLLAHARQFQEASAEFGRTIALRPRHAEAYAGRAFAYLCLEKWRQAAADYSSAVELGDWDKVDADLERATGIHPGAVGVAYWHALARLGAGDRAGYRSACAAMLEYFDQVENDKTANWMAWAFVLAPQALPG